MSQATCWSPIQLIKKNGGFLTFTAKSTIKQRIILFRLSLLGLILKFEEKKSF